MAVNTIYYKLSLEIEESYNKNLREIKFNSCKSNLDSSEYDVRRVEMKLFDVKQAHEIKLKSFLTQYPDYPAYAALMELARFAIKIETSTFDCSRECIMCDRHISDCDCFDD